MAGPWEKYQGGGQPQPIVRAPVQAPAGFRRVGPDAVAPIAGGPEDLATIRAQAAAQTGTTAAINAAMQRQLIQAKLAADLERARREKEIKDAPAPPPTLSPEALRAARIDAIDKIILARKLREKSANEWFATGFLADTASKIGGTPAKSVKTGSDTLKSAGALANIIKMAAANGGKNPLTPMSNSDVDLIANGTANLDIGQADTDYQDNVGLYEDAYRRGFQGAGGTNLEQAIAWRKRMLAAQKKGRAPIKSSGSNDGWTVEVVNK